MLQESDGKLQLGRAYTEALSVKNSGNIDEYVRVRVYKNWTKKDGSKETTLSPSLIILNLTQNGWIIDEASSTEERTVLYWPNILKVGESTAALSDTLTIDPSIGTKVTKNTEKKDLSITKLANVKIIVIINPTIKIFLAFFLKISNSCGLIISLHSNYTTTRL